MWEPRRLKESYWSSRPVTDTALQIFTFTYVHCTYIPSLLSFLHGLVLTPDQNSKGSLVISYMSISTINFPCLSSVPFQTNRLRHHTSQPTLNAFSPQKKPCTNTHLENVYFYTSQYSRSHVRMPPALLELTWSTVRSFVINCATCVDAKRNSRQPVATATRNFVISKL